MVNTNSFLLIKNENASGSYIDFSVSEVVPEDHDGTMAFISVTDNKTSLFDDESIRKINIELELRECDVLALYFHLKSILVLNKAQL
jgi:hypothetical protein